MNSAYRNAQIYVRGETARLLRYVKLLYPMRNDSLAAEGALTASVDQIADSIITTAIETHYPLAIQLQHEHDRIDREYLAKTKHP